MPIILIADDEKNIRAGIHKILCESIPGDILYFEAKNGEEALELVKKEHPDILITDIRMPRMDGLELMRTIRIEMHENISIIVLSGYDDFSYAQKAITYNASSYIVKPVDKKELVHAVLKTITELELLKKRCIEHGIRKIIETGRISESIPLIISVDKVYYFMLIVWNNTPEHIEKEHDNTEFDQYYYIKDEQHYRIILIDDIVKNKILSCAIPGALYSAISKKCTSISGLINGWKQMWIVSYCHFFAGKEHCFVYNEPERSIAPGCAETTIRRLIDRIGIVETDLLKKYNDELFSVNGFSVEEQCEYYYYLHEYYLRHIADTYRHYITIDMYLNLKNIILENAGLLPSLDDWKKNFSDFMLYLNIQLKRDHPYHSFIKDAIIWIDNHFAEDINMAVVANQVSVNYTYFSEKFKEHTGINFNEYLKRLRVDNAMSLLASGNYRVYEVALRSGYYDVKYFIKSFKEVTGLTPGEYRHHITNR
jgi:two-component system response regulator YesN